MRECLLCGSECVALIHVNTRHVGGIALDPMGRYAALTDNLGRVILLDVPHRQMLRMWKGIGVTCIVRLRVCGIAPVI
jgi:hypothetical protein